MWTQWSCSFQEPRGVVGSPVLAFSVPLDREKSEKKKTISLVVIKEHYQGQNRLKIILFSMTHVNESYKLKHVS